MNFSRLYKKGLRMKRIEIYADFWGELELTYTHSPRASLLSETVKFLKHHKLRNKKLIAIQKILLQPRIAQSSINIHGKEKECNRMQEQGKYIILRAQSKRSS